MQYEEFIDKVEEYGLEAIGRFYGSYKGFCFSNEDPEKLMRLKVSVPQIYGDDVPDTWAWSKGVPSGEQQGFTLLPNKGDCIWISFENGDPRYPIWEYGWFATGDMPKKATNTNTVIQFGENLIELNKTDGSITLTGKSGGKVELDKDGVVKINEGEKVELSGNTEAAALGDTLATKLQALVNILITAQATSFGAPLTSAPALAQWLVDLDTIKSSKVKLK